MGVDHGGTGGQVPPRIWSGGMLIQIVPQILSYRYKNERSVAFKNTPKSNRPGLRPGPCWGSLHYYAPPDTLVGWRGDTPPHMPPHSTRTHLRRSPCVPPEVQPDLRLWLGHVSKLQCCNMLLALSKNVKKS